MPPPKIHPRDQPAYERHESLADPNGAWTRKPVQHQFTPAKPLTFTLNTPNANINSIKQKTYTTETTFGQARAEE
jgi:hypothetical protein